MQTKSQAQILGKAIIKSDDCHYSMNNPPTFSLVIRFFYHTQSIYKKSQLTVYKYVNDHLITILLGVSEQITRELIGNHIFLLRKIHSVIGKVKTISAETSWCNNNKKICEICVFLGQSMELSLQIYRNSYDEMNDVSTFCYCRLHLWKFCELHLRNLRMFWNWIEIEMRNGKKGMSSSKCSSLDS